MFTHFYAPLVHTSVRQFTKSLVDREGAPVPRSSPDKACMDLDSGTAELLSCEARGYAENFVPQLPWQNTVSFTEPSNVPKDIPATAPATNLTLDWIHGFNSRESRQNVYYTKSGDSIVYPAGATGVKLSALGGTNPTQTYANDHNDKITCLAVHHVSKSVTHVATGQVGLVPKINVWASNTMETAVVLVGFHKKGISCLDFNPTGDMIVSIGQDDYHSVAVYDWKKKVAVFTSTTTMQPVLDCRWLSDDQVRRASELAKRGPQPRCSKRPANLPQSLLFHRLFPLFTPPLSFVHTVFVAVRFLRPQPLLPVVPIRQRLLAPARVVRQEDLVAGDDLRREREQVRGVRRFHGAFVRVGGPELHPCDQGALGEHYGDLRAALRRGDGVGERGREGSAVEPGA